MKNIAIVTILVSQIAPVENAYRDQLGYEPVHRGNVPAEQARQWAAPAMTGRPFLILAPASGRPVHLRFIEVPGGTGPDPGLTWGWNATELLATDPDALERQFTGTAFQVVGPARDLWNAPNAPRAMQAIGPANELLYFTRIIPGGFPTPMSPAVTPVDRVFIMVVGGPSMTALQDFYRSLGLNVSGAQPFRISTLSRAHGLPPETTYPLATAALPRDFLIELDEYPPSARPRAVAEGSLPPGVAMVTFEVESIGSRALPWRTPPAVLAEFPYSGRRAAVVVGPAGEWLELLEAHQH